MECIDPLVPGTATTTFVAVPKFGDAQARYLRSGSKCSTRNPSARRSSITPRSGSFGSRVFRKSPTCFSLSVIWASRVWPGVSFGDDPAGGVPVERELVDEPPAEAARCWAALRWRFVAALRRNWVDRPMRGTFWPVQSARNEEATSPIHETLLIVRVRTFRDRVRTSGSSRGKGSPSSGMIIHRPEQWQGGPVPMPRSGLRCR